MKDKWPGWVVLIVGFMVQNAVVAVICTSIAYSFLNSPADNSREISCSDLEDMNAGFLKYILGITLAIDGQYSMHMWRMVILINFLFLSSNTIMLIGIIIKAMISRYIRQPSQNRMFDL
jgi:hypothetical protein